MTSVFLLRVFFASRRSGRGRTYGATAPPITIDTETAPDPDGSVSPSADDTQKEE
jgi:hypothetical protein